MSQRRVLEISTPAEPDLLRIDGHEFAVRIGADLDTDIIAEILRLEQDMRRGRGKASGEKLAGWAERAKALVLRIAEMEEPPEDELAWLRRQTINLATLTEILAFVLPKGATEEVSEALTEGLPPGSPNGDETSDPTTSQRRSRSRRSRSARRSTSPLDTGEDSDGATSGSTSRTRTAA